MVVTSMLGTISQVGKVFGVKTGEDLARLQRQFPELGGVVVMAATDWQVIPTENLVAAAQTR